MMTVEQTCRLRELALAITRGDLRRPWSVQTSNSFRRIGTDRGDGDVLCAVTQPSDGHPDLHAPADVLDYIVAVHPLVVLELLAEVIDLRKLVDPDAEHVRLVLLKDATDAAIAEVGPKMDATYGEFIERLAGEKEALRVEVERMQLLYEASQSRLEAQRYIFRDLAADCHRTFDGGYKDAREREIFHHGMTTVCKIVEAAIAKEPA